MLGERDDNKAGGVVDGGGGGVGGSAGVIADGGGAGGAGGGDGSRAGGVDTNDGGVDADGHCSQEEKTVCSSSAPRQEMKAVLQNLV